MNANNTPLSFVRELIQQALPSDTAVYGEPPDIRYTFIPKGHEKVLHHDAMLVEGIRGAGKSFWWAVLQKTEHRRVIAHWAPRSGITGNTHVSVGFGEKSDPGNYPGKDVLKDLLKEFDPRHIWRSVTLRQILKVTEPSHPLVQCTWREAVSRIIIAHDEVENIFHKAEQQQTSEQRYHLILFDALDRTADDWDTMAMLIRGLLQVVLEFRSYKYLRLKAFLRPDHIDGVKMDFPDSSKILNERVKLIWNRNELYGLLWQYLGNEPNNGKLLRDECLKIIPDSWLSYESVWTPSEILRNDELLQKKLFHAISGPWMGKDQRRGFPYTWLPSHLGDSLAQVSPRSFLAALRVAASDKSRTDYPYPIHYESIKKGVREASQIRVSEMLEDYPWVAKLMEPLAGLNVPVPMEEINSRWHEAKVLELLKNEIIEGPVKLPPKNLRSGTEGVISDLIKLGVFTQMSDKRYNMPDVYRVGYGLGRKGGVKSMTRRSEK